MAKGGRSGAVVVISRSATRERSRARFEDEVIRAIARTGCAARLIVVPHIYYLKPTDEAARGLARLASPVVAASWLHPRAARWVLGTLGCDAKRVRAVGFRHYGTAEECVRAIDEIIGRKPKAAGRRGPASRATAAASKAQELKGSRRRRWYPVLDYERCKNCKQCQEFCLFGVYSLDGAGQVVVTRPDACKDGCPACARVCPAGAIMFPHYEDDARIAGAAEAIARRAARRTGKGGSARRGRGPGRAGRDSRAPKLSRRRRTQHPSKKAIKDELDALMDELEKLDES